MTQVHAVLLAAGDGKRFFASGGETYKQLALIDGQPIIRRIASQLAGCRTVGPITVVVGENQDCANALKLALDQMPVRFVENRQSRNDNNFLSFMRAIEGVASAVMAVEADCVMDAQDLNAMSEALSHDELRWSNVGDLSRFEYGGVVETNSAGDRVQGVHILDKEHYAEFKRDRHGLKMFGVTTFGEEALNQYRIAARQVPATGKYYFHECALRNPALFRHTTRSMSAGAYSFNTVLELQN